MPDAHAGTYAVTYSGGQSVSVGVNVPGGTYTQPYSVNSGGTYGGAASTSWATPTASATCSGGITAIATWQPSGPGDNPPATAIVVETGTASWSGTGVIVPTGKCDDGLKDPEVDKTTPPTQHGAPTSVSGVSTGVHYKVKTNPGQSFTLTPTPSANVSCAPTPGGGSASVSYTLAVFPVTIDPVGATSDGNGGWDVLVGQEVSPDLIGIPASCTVSNYNWAVTGITMQSWTVSTDQSQSHTTEVDGSGPLNIEDPIWFWNDPKNTVETITCTSVTVTPPVGQGTAFTVTTSQKVGVYLPSWTAFGYGGEMLVDTKEPNANGTDYWLHAGPVSGSNESSGMIWQATLAPPNAPVKFDMGNIYIVQVITPSEGYTNKSHQQFQASDYGQTGLDTSWPYGWEVYEDPGYQPYYVSSDSPGIDLTAMQAIYGSLPDTFVDYIMYQPPSDTEYPSPLYVPLGNFQWSTNGTATLPGNNTWANYKNPAGAVTPSGSRANFMPSNKYPSWTQNSGNGYNWVPVP